MRLRQLLGLVLILYSSTVLAHKPSDSYLTLAIHQATVQGQWDIALRDLDYAIGVDTNGDGAITWGELRARHAAIAAYALAHLQIATEEGSCPSGIEEHLVDHHTDGAYAVLRFKALCPSPVQHLIVHYRLLFDLDPQHRGLLHIEHEDQTHTAILSPDHPRQRIELATATPWKTFLAYGWEGIWHILTGYDHILFLLSLLLPAVLQRQARRWEAVASFRPALLEVIKIVTAFTLAHSMTLSLAALGVISLPARWVESAIAASVILAALNNL
ncbi:MAG: HupE/UreJ family protein, partial [Acidobacteria bacterium]|nr:HupE/UreJ family protein [Acidobacteriota bacterium]